MYFAIGVVFLLFVLAGSSIKILREYERGVVFFLGRFDRVKGPGLIFVVPPIQQMVRVDLRTRVFDVPPQDVITRDNVSVKVNAVVYLRVVDPQLAIIQVANFSEATSQLSQTTLRAVLGKHELDQLLAEREKLNSDIQDVLDKQTDAAEMLAKRGEAMQLRYLQTLTQIAGDKSSTIVFPVPLDALSALFKR